MVSDLLRAASQGKGDGREGVDIYPQPTEETITKGWGPSLRRFPHCHLVIACATDLIIRVFRDRTVLADTSVVFTGMARFGHDRSQYSSGPSLSAITWSG